MHLEYQLTQKEIKESLKCRNWKREGIFKTVNIIILTVVIMVAIIEYAKHPDQFYIMILAVVALFLLFYLIYVVSLRRTYQARKILKNRGIYIVDIKDEEVDISLESEHVFTWKKGNETYCVPKRILESEQEEELRKIINRNAKKKYLFMTGRA